MEPDLFWFPWCTSAYIKSFVADKVAELKASNEYFDVHSSGGRIYVQVARNPYGCSYMDKKEWEHFMETDELPWGCSNNRKESG